MIKQISKHFLTGSDVVYDNDYLALMDTNEDKSQTEEYADLYLKNEENGLIEYDELENEIEADLTDTKSNLHSHTLFVTEGSNDGIDTYYHCMECNASYATIEQFSAMHAHTEESIEASEVAEPLWQAIDLKDEAAVSSGKEESNNFEELTQITDEAEEQLLLNDENAITDAECESQKFFCYDCQKVFDDLVSAEQHDCGTTSTKTSLGVTSTATTANKQQRGKNMLNSRLVKCSICSTAFDNEKNLRFHMRIHNKPEMRCIQDALPASAQQQYNELNQFYCEICNRSFDQNLLAVHKNMHQNVEEYTCGVCNRKFENRPSYEMHMKLHADRKPKLERQVTSGAIVQQQNTGRAPYTCQYCGHSFSRPYEKVKHERVHTGEKPYECEVCGKSFRVSYSLTLHLRTHTDIRPYLCTICNKRFKSYPVYAHHLRIHSTERPYACDMCSKSFRTSVQLYAHKNSHTKPFNCPDCNRPFASLYAVKLHLKTHSKDDTSKNNENTQRCTCPVCGAKYTRHFALRYHLRDVHGIEIMQDNKLDPLPAAVFAVDEMALSSASDEAVLIAAAAQADVYNLNDANDIGLEMVETDVASPATKYVASEVITETTLSQDAFSIDSFATEEVITDWISK